MHRGIGFNYRLPNISAAIGYGQLKSINQIIVSKKRIYKRYFDNLSNNKKILIPKIRDYTTNYVMWVFNLEINQQYCKKSLMSICSNLYKKGIETRPAFVPINEQVIFQKKFPKYIRKNSCPNASKLMKTGFYLPSGNNLQNHEIDHICDFLLKEI